MTVLLSRLEPKDASGCIIATDDGSLLLQLRDDCPAIFFPNRWGLFGGAIEQGETPKDAVAREVEEELTLGVDKNRFSYCGRIEMQIFNFRLFRYFFYVKLSQQEITTIKLTEGQKFGIFSSAEINSLQLTPYDEYFYSIWKNR